VVLRELGKRAERQLALAHQLLECLRDRLVGVGAVRHGGGTLRVGSDLAGSAQDRAHWLLAPIVL
jgi:hypothetical protein